MTRFRTRFKRKKLRAKYVCPECKRTGYYPCGARTEYAGFTKLEDEGER